MAFLSGTIVQYEIEQQRIKTMGILNMLNILPCTTQYSDK